LQEVADRSVSVRYHPGMAMTLRLSDEETSALRAAADAEGVSMQEFARAAIRARTDGWARERDRFLASFAQENAGLLHRLSQ